MLSAVAAVEVAAVDILYVVASSTMPELFLILSSWVPSVHLFLLRHVQQVQVWVLYSLNLLPASAAQQLDNYTTACINRITI